jgi:Flp pilus assembly protein TadG
MVHRRDAGAAAVEFVLISVLLIFLLFAVFQVALYFYARNIVAASAADAARYAAAADVPAGAGGPRAEQLISQGLDRGDASAISCASGTGTDPDSGLAVEIVRCTGRLHAAFTPLTVPLDLTITSSALKEGTS